METEEKSVNATVCCTQHDQHVRLWEAMNFADWVSALGGDNRVAKLLKVDRMTIWRYSNAAQAIPGVWLQCMLQSEVLANLRQEIAKLKRGMK